MQENCIEISGFQAQTMIVSLMKNYSGYKITNNCNKFISPIVLLLMLKVLKVFSLWLRESTVKSG